MGIAVGVCARLMFRVNLLTKKRMIARYLSASGIKSTAVRIQGQFSDASVSIRIEIRHLVDALRTSQVQDATTLSALSVFDMVRV